MEVDEAAIVLQKIFGPVLLVLSTIVLSIVLYEGVRALGTAVDFTLTQWIFGFIFSLSGLGMGIYICQSKLGWFSRKK